MAIVDNRTLLIANDTTDGNLDDLTGAADTGADDTETFIEGDASRSVKVSNAVDGLLYDAGSAQNWSNNHFYIWWNVSTAGKLDTQAGGGVRIRFCGATVTDWFEVYIAGSDVYTGGFQMAVIDVETARANAVGGTLGGTNGTTPATSAIRYVGVVFDMVAMISGNVNNCFIDSMWRLPQNTPGLLVEGQNTGSVDWTWADLVAAADIGDTTKAWGTVREENGIVFINTPIRFGANDAVTHGFSDENVVIAWEDQLVDSAFYGLEVIGGSGTQSFQAGVVDGTGDDRAGSQGWVITAASSGERWYFDADDANVDVCNLYGCTFQHGGAFQLDDAAVTTISTSFVDCTSAVVSNSTFLKNSIINANTADGVAFLTTDDLGDVVRCAFIFSDGHGIELTTPRVAAQTSKGNTFTGYGTTTSNDAAIYNNAAGLVDISVTDGGSVSEHTYRDGASASTTVTGAVDVTVTPVFVGSEVRAYRTSDGVEVDGVENTATTSETLTLVSGQSVTVVVHSAPTASRPNDTAAIPIRLEGLSFTADQDLVVAQQVDRNFSNPA